MKSRMIIMEEELKTYRVKHNFEIHQGDSKIATLVDIKVTASTEEEAKSVGDAQMEKLMAYMRSGASQGDVKPQKSKQTTSPSHEDENEEVNAQLHARNFWQTKKSGSENEEVGSLSSFSEAEKDALFIKAVNEVKGIGK